MYYDLYECSIVLAPRKTFHVLHLSPFRDSLQVPALETSKVPNLRMRLDVRLNLISYQSLLLKSISKCYELLLREFPAKEAQSKPNET